MTDQTPQPKTKRVPYAGDPNTKLTMCDKKLRRHRSGDISYVFLPTEETDEDGRQLTAVAPICRHCQESPVKEESDAQA